MPPKMRLMRRRFYRPLLRSLMSQPPLRIGDVMVEARHVQASQTLKAALEFMTENRYDQVPVLDVEGGRLVGVLSHQFLSEDRVATTAGPMLGRPVRESMRKRDKLPEGMVTSGGDDLIDAVLMSFLYEHAYVLVEEPEGTLSIASTWDVANGFLQRW